MKLNIATWNVLTLRKTGAPELLTHELERYNVSIAGLCEARWTGSGETIVNNRLIVWSGHETRARGGVALALAPNSRRALISWQPVCDRILTARLEHRYGKITVVVAYAPTEVADSEVKDAYYSRLETVMTAVPPHDVCILLTDANATISEDARNLWPGAVGNVHVDSSTNDNGARLLDLCQSSGLIVADTWFPRRRIHHWTWYSNDHHTKKAVDHILISSRWRNAVTNCRVYRGAQLGNTDHRMLVATIHVRLKTSQNGSPQSKIRFDSSKLRDPAIAERFAVNIANRFTALSNGSNEDWDVLKQTIHTSASKIFQNERPPPRRPWISADSLELIEKRRHARLCGDLTEYRRLNQLRNASLNADKERYWTNAAEKLESAASQNNQATLYRTLRELSNETQKKHTLVKDRHGAMLNSNEDCLNRWKEHFSELLNHPPIPVDPDLENAARNPASSPTCSIDLVSVSEVKRQIKKLQNRRAPGICNITAEMLKSGGDALALWLTEIINAVWVNEVIPDDWRKGVILPFWKRKGDIHVCANHRGITLLSIPGKLFSRILIDRARPALQHNHRIQQSGFTPGHSTMDHISSVRLLIEKAYEYRRDRDLCIAFIDLKAAFDSVDRNSIWYTMYSIGVPEKIIRLLKLMHTGNESSVRANKSESASFEISSGVRQGCTAAPDLFNCLLDHLMRRVSSRIPGFPLGDYAIKDLEFADDTVLFAPNIAALKEALEVYEEEASKIGLVVNFTKTKVMIISESPQPTTINVNQHTVDVVQDFIYLGSSVSANGDIKRETRRRRALANSAMRRLWKPLWSQRSVSDQTKMRVYNACVLSVLLYGSETWPLSTTHAKELASFDNRAQRKILRIRWQEHITNSEVRSRSKQPPLQRVLAQRRLRWLGHMLRMPENHPTRTVMDFNPQRANWRRPRGRPQTRWLDVISADLQAANKTLPEARVLAQNRDAWRRMVLNVASTPHRHEN